MTLANSESSYNGIVITANKSNPFGMQMPGRKFSQANSTYRYGFNGKEKSDEVYGDGNIYDYGFRIYNPRLGRFLSVDPLTNKYAELTPYQFSSSNPIFFIDIDGQEGDYYFKRDGNSHLIFINYVDQGKGKPNRIFVMDGLTSAGKKENRLKKDGAYWEQRMTPTSMYSEENHRAKSGADSQFDIDRRNWLWGSGSDYSDKNWWQRYKADGKDNPDKEVAVQLIAMMFMPTRIKTETPTAETPIKSTNNQAKSSTAAKNPAAAKANTAIELTPTPVEAVINEIKSGNWNKVVNNLEKRVAANKPIENNQEFNITLYGPGKSKMNIRIETHTLPEKFGGNGANGTPVRHMNVEATDVNGSKVNLSNDGHIIL